jgi:UDP-N-acetylglucosamine--N-acetylmuramyl-(pentapeptide) pyrophosphoryl-undecaprenol N-acetylglucosamine transferase
MNSSKKTKKIMLAGGGTGGSVTPLLGIAEELFLDKSGSLDWEIVFVGTNYGPEKEMVASFSSEVGPIRFIPIVSGKLRRYFSLANLLDILKITFACFVSVYLLAKEKPAVIISAGSFVAVPLIFVASLFNIPVLVHQSDVRPGLANRLCAPLARKVSVAFSQSLTDFPGAVWTGNPVRRLAVSKVDQATWRQKYKLSAERPLVLVTGGGTGATAINNFISLAAPLLVNDCQIIHVTGKGKKIAGASGISNYQVFEFLPHREVLGLMELSDLIVSRCGLAFLTELSALGKAAILIPMPNSHQEDNAQVFATNSAAIVLHQVELSPEKLAEEIKQALSDKPKLLSLSQAAQGVMKRGGALAISQLVRELAKV